MAPRLAGMLYVVPAVFALASLACAGGPGQPQRPDQICGGVLAGDLVVSEFMADPQDSDTGKQYVELYNTTPRDIALDGISLFQSLTDGSREKGVVMRGASAPGHGYFVLGDSATNAVTGFSYVDHGYATGLGALRHTDGRIGIRCGTKLIDDVSYAMVDSGRARELDGAFSPDSARSASVDSWCNASQPLDELPPAGGNFGTPGAPNSVCAKAASAGTCVDPKLGERRMTKPPSAGDLVISEVMAAPAAVSEADGEWFELYARADVDLNELTVRAGSSMALLSDESCLRIPAGSYAILARSSDPKLNAGLPQPVATVGITLPDGSSFLSISNGEAVVDELHWKSAKKGVAWQLSANAMDASPAERANAFCPASQVYGQGDQGSPGARNEACALPVPDDSDAGNHPDADAGTAMGTCLDALSGLPRDPVSPRLGALVITEVLAAPSVGNGGPGEWVEVLAQANVDLNGLELSNESSGHTTLTSPTCLSVKAGDWLLFARSADATQNGGLPPVTATFAFALADAMSAARPERVLALGFDGSELDRVAWSKTTRGTSLQRSASELGTIASSAPTWCLSPSTTTFGAGDRGTPAARNLPCP